jgi:RNA polymerase sigma-70 factor (ECF subfamily)
MNVDELLSLARAGNQSALGELLESYRNYLRLLARLRVGQRLQAKIDGSDVVQEALLRAGADFGKFRGAGEAEFAAWLRTVLVCIVANHVRHYSQQRRDANLERRLEEEFDRSSQQLGRYMIAPESSPTQKAMRRERALVLANALAELPDNYREALILREFENLTLPEIAQRMDRSPDAVRKMLARGLLRLRSILKDQL